MSEELDDLFNFNPEQIKQFEEAEETSSSRSNPPDGDYTVKVAKAFGQKTAKGELQLNLHLKITNGEHKGRLLFKNYFLDGKNSKIGISYLKKDLVTCGIKLKGLDELKEKLPDLLDLNLAVVKKTKDPTSKFYNLFINSLLSEDSDPDYQDNDSDRM